VLVGWLLRRGPACGGRAAKAEPVAGAGPAAPLGAALIRRLIAERRIEFVKVGRHVRISESALTDFIDSGRVEPLTTAHNQRKMRGVA
jgi:excisionase family DNA binding protein